MSSIGERQWITIIKYPNNNKIFSNLNIMYAKNKVPHLLVTLTLFSGGFLVWLLAPQPDTASANNSDFTATYNRISSEGISTGYAHIFPSSPVEGVESSDGDVGAGQPTGEGVPRPTPSLQVRATAKPNTKVQARGVAKTEPKQQPEQPVGKCYRSGVGAVDWKVERSRELWKRMTDRGWSFEGKKIALMTQINEADFNERAHGDKDIGGAYGIAMLYIPVQKGWIKAQGRMSKDGKLLSSFFDWSWQMDTFLDKYADGTPYYGYRDEKRPAVKAKKAKKALALITCN